MLVFGSEARAECAGPSTLGPGRRGLPVRLIPLDPDCPQRNPKQVADPVPVVLAPLHPSTFSPVLLAGSWLQIPYQWFWLSRGAQAQSNLTPLSTSSRGSTTNVPNAPGTPHHPAISDLHEVLWADQPGRC